MLVSHNSTAWHPFLDKAFSFKVMSVVGFSVSCDSSLIGDTSFLVWLAVSFDWFVTTSGIGCWLCVWYTGGDGCSVGISIGIVISAWYSGSICSTAFVYNGFPVGDYKLIQWHYFCKYFSRISKMQLKKGTISYCFPSTCLCWNISIFVKLIL